MHCIFGRLVGQEEEAGYKEEKIGGRRESIVGAEYRLGQEELNMGAQAIHVPGSTLVLEAASWVPVFHQGPL